MLDLHFLQKNQYDTDYADKQAYFTKESRMSKKLLKSTAVVSFMTLLSRISGLARDVIFARFFGADATTDAFFVAFKIPNLLRRQFAEGAFSQAFVPVFTEYKTTKSLDATKKLAADVAGTLGWILFVVTVIGVIATPLLVLLFAPGWAGGDPRYDLTAEMLRLTFPYIFFISLVALAGGILNTHDEFAVPAFTPVLLNISMIAAAIWLAPMMDKPVMALAWGVFIAGAAQLLFQLPFLLRLKVLGMPKWNWRDPGVTKIRTLMIPAIFSSSVQQINLLIDYWIASFLISGSISWLYYADRLVEFPLGVFGIAIATVILPSLSAKFAKSDPGKFNRTLDWGLRVSLLVGMPATVGLILLSGPLLITIFQYGEFDTHDVRMAQLALLAYSVGLMGFIYVKVLSPGYFARQDTKTPMKIAINTMVLKLIVTLIFVVTMVQFAYEAPHVGLALATALSAIYQSFLLYRGLRKEGVYTPDTGWGLYLFRLILASTAMGVVLFWGINANALWAELSLYERILDLAMWVVAGMAVYVATLLVSGLNIKSILHHG